MKSIVHLRISDNVLEEDDWPVVEATLTDGRITELKEIKSGVYSWGVAPTIGWLIKPLLTWLRYDPTGSHPETYHEIRIPEQEWEIGYFYNAIDDPGSGERKLKEILERAAVE